jgi:UDP-N-acetylmuramate dehydrogenase
MRRQGVPAGAEEVAGNLGVQRDFPLARLTTIRTGGAADFFARPHSERAILGLLRWAAAEDVEVGVIGSGSNLLVSDGGFRGLVLKLDGELSAIERDGSRVVCGGGARMPSAAAKVARWGLSGLEFGVNIPGTVGGAVRMNANAYGGELGRVLEWACICSAAGVEERPPDRLGFAYRRSNLRPGEVISGASFRLRPADPDTIRATLADMRGRRREAQPSGIKTFGSTFKNPDPKESGGRTAGQLLEAAGCRGLQIGGARFSPVHANFVENRGDATTADVLTLMAAGRRQVRDRFGIDLDPEVQVLGEVEWPADWVTEDHR